ncbi:MAG TPA: hypothetical protein VKQ71_10460 [Acidimicrobiales bacterium]|nr:hypothetical protein [Acidimicrobiales bacterium]
MSTLSPADQATLTGRSFFPHLIAGPFMHGLRIAFTASIIMCFIAAAASWLRGGRYLGQDEAVRSAGSPEGPDGSLDEVPERNEWVPA